MEFAKVISVGELVRGYIIWYEDFSLGCWFCGDIVRVIDSCPLLNSPKKTVTIKLVKNPNK